MAVVLVFSRARLLSVRMSSFVHSRRFTVFFAIYVSLHQSCGNVSGVAGARYLAPFGPLAVSPSAIRIRGILVQRQDQHDILPRRRQPPIKFPSRGHAPTHSDATEDTGT